MIVCVSGWGILHLGMTERIVPNFMSALGTKYGEEGKRCEGNTLL